jgi:nicotinamidase-related amidase
VATDYCVKAAAQGLVEWGRGRAGPRVSVALVTDAIGAVDVQPGDGARALAALEDLGCRLLRTADVLP